MKIDHIGIAVSSLKDVEDFVRKVFGKGFDDVDEVPSQKVRVGFINLENSKLEFVEALSDESPIKKYIDKRGEGIHHICVEVNDIDGTIKILKEKGVKLVDEKAREGSVRSKVAFLYPFHGLLLELKEKK